MIQAGVRAITRVVAALTGFVAALAAVLLAGGLVVPVASASAAPAADPAGKVDRELRQQLRSAETSDFLVTFRDRADLTAASRTEGWAERGQAVVDALRATAERSQRGIRQRLSATGVAYHSFWVSNVLYVRDGTERLADQLAGRGEVASLASVRTYQLPEPAAGTAEALAGDVEWGVADIRADDVWADFQASGQDIVVANIDSGVQFDHPALVASYRGNAGDGTFDHDHNWFDPSGICQNSTGAPCDNNGHGSHTMGTMVGDAGAGNRIGVAPGARWIAAKGCEDRGCSSFALLASAEWVLAPTDGDGADPRVDLRPHVVNNSWGASNGPIADPWYNDAVDAWIAAGMFPAFSNGNAGPGCDSAGSPGDAVHTYSAGMYDIDGVIDQQSSRGPGAGGELKPNIAAPGVNVRSSVPGDGYASFSGTSMASPHLSGAVALLWSAAPVLVGDIDQTRQLLDQTAADVDDTSCGGTAADNNVYGEGRLNAYELVRVAPRGPSGTLRGRVTEQAGGEVRPIGGAEVTVDGPTRRQLVTAPDGTYAVRLPVGDYTVTGAAFGYTDESAPGTVTNGGTTTVDLRLTALPTVRISGTVTEGSAHGWPLYATVTVAGVPNGTFHTDPATGRYSFRLPAGAGYDVTVAAKYPGHEPLTGRVEAGDTDLVRDFELAADGYACTAPGYAEREPTELLREPFDQPDTPAGWTVVDNQDNGQVWRFDDHRGFGNRTGGNGLYAWVFSAEYGPDGRQDTELVSPVVNLSGSASPAVWFNTDYSDGVDSLAELDVSTDGGTTWGTAWQHTRPSIRGSRIMVPIPQAAGADQVRVRFHYRASFATWWQLDDVMIGNRNCDPVPGGLVLGHVRDRNDDSPLVAATVRSTSQPQVRATTVSTPADPGLDDGFYWMFAPVTGSHEFAADQTRYQSQTVSTELRGDAVHRQDFSLGAGLVTVEQTDVAVSQPLGQRAERTVTVRNDGTAAVRLELAREAGDVEPLAKAAGAPEQRIAGRFEPGPAPAGRDAGSAAAEPAPVTTPSAGPWGPIADYPVAVMDNAVAYHHGEVYSTGGSNATGTLRSAYRYDPETMSWERIADLPRARHGHQAVFLGDILYVTGGWSSTGDARAEVDRYDPHTNTWSTGPAMPEPRAGAGYAVLGGKLYLVGGCGLGGCGLNDVHRFDPAAQRWERLANYPRDTSWLACGGIGGRLYCAGGVADESAASVRTYGYDPASNAWTRLADMPIDQWAASSTTAEGRLLVAGGAVDNGRALTNRGFAFDPAADTWSALPNSNYATYRGGSACGFYKIGGSTGGFTPSALSEVLAGWTDCGTGDPAPWLTAGPASTTVQPGQSVQLRLTMDAGLVDQPGTYTAAVRVRNDGPDDTDTIRVAMDVGAPREWGKVAGEVTGRSCSGDTVPLAGAVVRITSPGGDHTLRTDAEGRYGLWLDRRTGQLELLAVRDGWFPETATARVRAGRTTVQDFTLSQTGCVAQGFESMSH